MSSTVLLNTSIVRPSAFLGSISAVALALLCTASSVRAQDAVLDNAAAKLTRHDPSGAYALLADVEAQRAGQQRFDYLFGVAALDSGHVTRAIFALERLVQAQPENLLAHAELGRAYFAAGDPDSARSELRQARAGLLPAGASAAIDRLISVVDQVAPPSGPRVHGYLEAGIGYDTNVNSATNQGEFAIPGFGGILFTTSPDSRQRGDAFASAAGGIVTDVALSPAWTLTTAANVHGTADRVMHDMNTDLLDATLAVRHTVGGQSQTLALQDGTTWVGSRLYRSANGASAQWQSQFDASSQGSVFAQWSHQAYSGQFERNTNRSVLGVGYGHDFNATATLAYCSVYAAHEVAGQAQFANFGHHALGLRLGLEQRVWSAATAFIDWQHEQRRYGGTEPFFETRRHDREDDVSMGVRYALGDQWQLLPQIHYTRAGSNVVLYAYVRSVFQIAAHRSFQ